MATHSNVLAWRIPGSGESGGLPSMGPVPEDVFIFLMEEIQKQVDGEFMSGFTAYCSRH